MIDPKFHDDCPTGKCEWCWDMCEEVDADSERYPELCQECAIKKFQAKQVCGDD